MTSETAGRRLTGFTRALHIYLTMLACFMLFFFSLTGFMLNHSDWFGLEEIRTRKAEGRVAQGLLDPLDKLAVVESLRSEHGVQGALESFDTDGDEYRLVFKRPGSRSEAIVERKTGRLGLSTESRGVTAVWTDLHKGASSGSSWKWVIDATSIFLFLASLTGLILWMSLPRRRRIGVAALAGGLIVSFMAYWFFVP